VSESGAKFVEQFADESGQALKEFVERDLDNIVELGRLVVKRLESGGKIVFFGNGGSAADAQHLATEFVGRCFCERGPLAAIALTTDTSCLTAIANDYGYDEIFARQVDALVNNGDVAVGISTSGNSPNVLKGLEAAKRRGAATVGFTGCDGGRMTKLCNLSFLAPSQSTQITQQIHITLGHILVGLVEKALFMPEGEIG